MCPSWKLNSQRSARKIKLSEGVIQMMMKRVLFLIKCSCVLFYVSMMGLSCAETKPAQIVGGPCSYKSYPGTAEVISVEKVYASKEAATRAGSGYDVRFVYYADTAPEETYVRVKGKTHSLLLTNGTRPRSGFLKKYNIAAGNTLPCELAVIVKGTCTPILFKFPTVDLTDYEANR